MIKDTAVSYFFFAHGHFNHALADMGRFNCQIREFQRRVKQTPEKSDPFR